MHTRTYAQACTHALGKWVGGSNGGDGGGGGGGDGSCEVHNLLAMACANSHAISRSPMKAIRFVDAVRHHVYCRRLIPHHCSSFTSEVVVTKTVGGRRRRKRSCESGNCIFVAKTLNDYSNSWVTLRQTTLRLCAFFVALSLVLMASHAFRLLQLNVEWIYLHR